MGDKINIEFTKEELIQLKIASNDHLLGVARLERHFDIKLVDTIATCAAVHKKILLSLAPTAV